VMDRPNNSFPSVCKSKKAYRKHFMNIITGLPGERQLLQCLHVKHFGF